MTYEVQQTRWDRIVRRVSGSIGPGSRVSETLSELFPVMDVERVPAELLVLGGTRMCQGHSNEPAVAAVFQVSELFNPVDSEAIITLMSVSMFSDVSPGFGMGLTDGSFTNDNPTLVGFTDGRLFTSARPLGQVRDETAGAAGVNTYLLGRDLALVNIFRPERAVAVLSPGTGYSVGATQVNSSLNVSYTWMERPAEQAELQF